MTNIHPTAVVAEGAILGRDVSIGPYCTVGGDVRLDDGVTLISHVVVGGITDIGANTKIFPFASIGLEPQDKKHRGEPTKLIIGANNIIRESATMHPGTVGGGGTTRVGNNGLFMVNTHVAHDCIIGDHVIMANNSAVGGHVTLGDYVILGGNSAIHQFVRIGRHAMIGGMSGSESDVIPYGSVMGLREGLSGLNLTGLRRRGFTRDEIHALRTAYRLLFAEEGTLTERVNDVAEMYQNNAAVMEIVEFIRADSARSICQPHFHSAA
jgi:UDP-N-acetylglucosamine acyltransferase